MLLGPNQPPQIPCAATQDRMTKLEQLRLELDSRRRTVDALQRACRLPVGIWPAVGGGTCVATRMQMQIGMP